MASETRTGERTQRMRERILEEMRRFFIMFLYLWVLFGLFVLNERIILSRRGFGVASQGFAIFNALVLAKVMLVAEDLKFGGWLRDRPLIVPIMLDTAAFSTLFLIFHVMEDAVVGLLRGKSAASSVPEIGGGGLAGVVCVTLILFFALLPYFTFVNIGRVLGPGRLKAILLRSPLQNSFPS